MPLISSFSSVYKPIGNSFKQINESPFATGPFNFDFDYMVVEYFFTDGNDMDTMTYISNPAIMNNDFAHQLPGDYVGTCAESNNGPQFPNDNVLAPYLIYGGDNTGVGTEAVLFNLVEFKSQRTWDINIEITFTATWYGTPGANPVITRATMWKGGTPIQDGYTFINPSATNTKMVQSDGHVLISNTQNCEAFEPVSKFIFNVSTYNGQFLNPNSSPTPTPTATITPTQTPSVTPTMSSTMNPTASPSMTPTRTATPTMSSTMNPTASPSMTPTMTVTPTNSATPTPTNTPSSSSGLNTVFVSYTTL